MLKQFRTASPGVTLSPPPRPTSPPQVQVHFIEYDIRTMSYALKSEPLKFPAAGLQRTYHDCCLSPAPGELVAHTVIVSVSGSGVAGTTATVTVSGRAYCSIDASMNGISLESGAPLGDATTTVTIPVDELGEMR